MKKKHSIMLLATFICGALVFVTWTKIALSRWIVGHSGVGDMMEREGKHTELFFLDVFFTWGLSFSSLKLSLEVFSFGCCGADFTDHENVA